LKKAVGLREAEEDYGGFSFKKVVGSAGLEPAASCV